MALISHVSTYRVMAVLLGCIHMNVELSAEGPVGDLYTTEPS